jgi:dihydroorotate dehydrogenase
MIDLYSKLRPILFALPPELAHAAVLSGVKAAHRLKVLPAKSIPKGAPVSLMGIAFPNRVGLAAGFDKNGVCIDALGALGFGFVEIGTVTPRSQSGSERPRLFRLREDRALINRMGFPNKGARAISEILRRRRYEGICGVSIGKNADTPLSLATEDYIQVLSAVYHHADYVAVNISSPNTSDLRQLQHGTLLRTLLSALHEVRQTLVRESGRHLPLLVKFTADLEDDEIANAVRITMDCGMDGIIATNTTVRREQLKSRNHHEIGGLSGRPLLPMALRAVERMRAVAGRDFPIMGVGGIDSAETALAMRAAGADIVQIYTGLIYRGPTLIGDIAQALANVSES